MKQRFFSLRGFTAKLSCIAFLAFFCALIFSAEEVKEAVLDSILTCLTVLAPSLFPFLALTSFAVNSGASEALGRLMGGVPRYLFRLPRVCTAALLLGFLGGYPAGAKGVSLLLKSGKITPDQAGRMMLFCVNPGIAFVVTFLGGSLLKSFSLGWLLFFSVTLSGILLGFLFSLFEKLPKEESCSPVRPERNALIRCAQDASASLLRLCSCVILFSGVIALLHGTGAFQALVRLISELPFLSKPAAAALLSFSLEVTKGSFDAASLGASLPIFAFGLAFGGFCVHLQVFSCFEEFPISKRKFFLSRFLHGLLSVAVCLLLRRFSPSFQEASFLLSSPAPVFSGGFRASAAGGASLLLMCCAFLLFLSRQSDCNMEENLLK